MSANGARRTDPLVGLTLGGYTLTRAIADGGMSRVYEARTADGDKVAFKLLHRKYAEHPDTLERFIREARIASSLDHRHIARYLGDGQCREGPFLVFELLRGRDLRRELRVFGRLPVDRAVRIALQTASALGAAHAAGVVHRDVKPENLFLAPTADELEHVKVIDFGLSKLGEDGGRKLTGAGDQLGTPHYMPPEQVADAADVDARADVYALAAVLFQMLTGDPPFDSKNPIELMVKISGDPVPDPRAARPEVPAGLANALRRALGKRPEDRFPSMDAFAEALRPYAEAEAVARTPRPGLRPAVAVVAAVLLALAAALAVWALA